MVQRKAFVQSKLCKFIEKFGTDVSIEFSCVSSDVEIQVLEEGVSDALFAEAELVFEGEKYDVLKLKVRECGDVTVVLRAVMVLQSKDGLIGLGILGLRFQVLSEEEHQGGQGDRVQVAGEVQVHREGVQCLQLLEDLHEASGVHLTGGGEVVQDVCIDAGSGGQLLVFGDQLNNLRDSVFNHGKTETGHFEGRPADGFRTASMVVGVEQLVNGVARRVTCHSKS